MSYFGVNREVRAVDGITMKVKRREVYGIAGESLVGQDQLRQGAGRRHPAAAAGRSAGSATYDFGG